MKKIFTLIAFITIALTSFGQKKIAYVSAATPTGLGDSLIRKELAKTYTIVDVSGAQTAAAVKTACEAADIAMVIFAEPLSSTATGVKGMQGVNKPLLNMKVFAYKKASAAWSWASTAFWFEDGSVLTTDIVSAQSSHQIFTGLTSPISILSAVSSSKGLSYTNIPSSFLLSGTQTTLSTITGNANNQSIVEIAAGSTYTDVTTSTTITIPQTYIQFGINTLSQPNITSDGLKLIVNICDYLTKDFTTKTTESQKQKLGITTTNGVLNVIANADGDIEVFNLSGNLIAKQSKVSSASFKLAQGVYVVHHTSNAAIIAEKVIVK